VQLTPRASAAWLAAFPILSTVTAASRVAGVKHVHALDMRPLGELRDHVGIVGLEVSVAESSELSAWIARVEHS